MFSLRQAADFYESILKVRIAATNRLGAVERATDDGPAPREIASNALVERLNDALEVVREEMLEGISVHPAAVWLLGVPGIHRTLAGRIVGLIPMEGPEDFCTFSKMRKFAGLAPGFNRLKKGEKAPFCKRLKVALFVAAGSFLKAQAVCTGRRNAPRRFYAEIYEAWRATYEQRGLQLPEKDRWSKLHQHLAAMDKMLDVFLSHLWKRWRQRASWPVPPLYVHERLGHQDTYDPDDFSTTTSAQRKLGKRRLAAAAGNPS